MLYNKSIETNEKTLVHFYKLVSQLDNQTVDAWLDNFSSDLLRIYLYKSHVCSSHKIELDKVDKGCNSCESPIEEMLLIGMVDLINSGIEALRVMNNTDTRYEENESRASIDLIIVPQALVGDYRIDFKVKYLEGGKIPIRENGIIINQADYIKEVLVECDGHDFHEKTKEQVQKDKKRDRDLASKGYTLLRFTGSEIWKDPFKCASEIYQYLAGTRDDRSARTRASIKKCYDKKMLVLKTPYVMDYKQVNNLDDEGMLSKAMELFGATAIIVEPTEEAKK